MSEANLGILRRMISVVDRHQRCMRYREWRILSPRQRNRAFLLSLIEPLAFVPRDSAHALVVFLFDSSPRQC